MTHDYGYTNDQGGSVRDFSSLSMYIRLKKVNGFLENLVIFCFLKVKTHKS